MSRIVLVVTVALGASLVVAGCFGSASFVVGPDHPASPDAAEVRMPAPSQTLALSTTRSAEPKSEVDGAPAHGGEHAGHADGVPATKPAESSTSRAAGEGVYTCPMHPEVVSDQPGRCPKCRMRLVLKENDQ